jgi:hypothetical protein
LLILRPAYGNYRMCSRSYLSLSCTAIIMHEGLNVNPPSYIF